MLNYSILLHTCSEYSRMSRKIKVNSLQKGKLFRCIIQVFEWKFWTYCRRPPAWCASSLRINDRNIITVIACHVKITTNWHVFILKQYHPLDAYLSTVSWIFTRRVRNPNFQQHTFETCYEVGNAPPNITQSSFENSFYISIPFKSMSQKCYFSFLFYNYIFCAYVPLLPYVFRLHANPLILVTYGVSKISHAITDLTFFQCHNIDVKNANTSNK
jgi:hypothetical protein